MLRFFARTDKSPIAQWWWTVDRWLVAAVVVLIGLGYLMAFAASPAVAQHIGKPIYYFANKQLVFLTLALGVFLAVSMLNTRLVRYLAIACFVVALVGVIATLFVGASTKGASRWLIIAGVSVQPSEILKPAFVVVSAGWLLCVACAAARCRPADAFGSCVDVHVFSGWRVIAVAFRARHAGHRGRWLSLHNPAACIQPR